MVTFKLTEEKGKKKIFELLTFMKQGISFPKIKI